MVAHQAVQFLSCFAPAAVLSWKSAAEFRCQVEAFPRQHLGQRLLLVSLTQFRFDSPGLFWKHAVGKDFHDHTAQLLVSSGSSQEFLAAALVKGDCVQLRLGDSPKSWENRAGQQAWHQIFPNERLHVAWDNKVLLHLRQGIRETSEGTGQMTAATRSPGADQPGSCPRLLPGVVPFRIIMGADKNRVVV